MKECIKCKKIEDLSKFYKSNKNKTGYENTCKSCKNKYSKKNSIKYKEYYKEYFKKWGDQNKEKISNYNKEYYNNNKQHFLEYNKKNKEVLKNWRKDNRKKLNKYQKNKYHENPQFKLGILLRQRFKLAIKGYKIKEIKNLIGCTIEKCKLHLEQQFKPEMTWENHGTMWEIDHIKACANFDLTKLEEQKQCFHYTNLQPLFKTTEIAESFGYINQIGNRNKNKY
jgi:hypothetical protein